MSAALRRLLSSVLFDIADRASHGLNLLSFIIGDTDLELLL
jgi:hypothetical protein